MPSRPASPTVRQRRLRAALRRLREDRGRPAAQVAAALGWSVSRLTRLETTSQEPKPHVVADLLDELGVTREERDYVLTLVKDARMKGWWQPHGLPDPYATYIGLEAEATVLRDVQLTVIPGLLQTPDYTTALIQGRTPGSPPDTVARLTSVRAQRQHLLTGPDPLHVRAIIGEPALRWMIGGPEVMREQLEHLVKLGDLDNVHLHVLPFTAGAHRASGSFAMLTFGDPLDPEVVHLETPIQDVCVEDRAEVERFGDVFESLIIDALGEVDSLGMISSIAADMVAN